MICDQKQVNIRLAKFIYEGFQKRDIHSNDSDKTVLLNKCLKLTLRAPRVLVPTPSTKGGGGSKRTHPSISRTRNATNLKPSEVLGVSYKA